ncbi:unnamed protein product [Mytilus coruscus]|uniref:OTU domain-containing protein n=1 Tax=Mytilus coruscus TaxID=42192 RepID=A0A6J8E0E9_MYTCO|nr:unnamed protein product [Mytilus coruscus]
MKENNVWGTELEILACADLFKTDIYTFLNNSWIRYSASQICSNNDVNNQAIYLQHLADINHYEVVTAVKSMSPSSFQINEIHRKDDHIERKSEVASKKTKLDKNQVKYSKNNLDNCYDELTVLSKAEKERIRYKIDHEFRTRKTVTLKRKYWGNEEIRLKKIKKYEKDQTYRESLIQSGIAKYHEDEDYRNTLIQSGISKYHEDEDNRNALIQSGIAKYHEDENYRNKLKLASVQKTKSIHILWCYHISSHHVEQYDDKG